MPFHTFPILTRSFLITISINRKISFLLFPRGHPCHVSLQVVMLTLILIFAIFHSGMASFRNTGEKLIGERAFRVLFAGISLPLAVTTIVSYYLPFPLNYLSSSCFIIFKHKFIPSIYGIMVQVYFINHRYDGLQLWHLNTTPGIHQLVWLSNFVSFFFLYPSTFNLLEIAAVHKPKIHLWETGIIRITRHPQVYILTLYF